MSFFKRIFNRVGAATHIPFEEMARDTSKPAADRARDMALAAAGDINAGQYQKFRNDQLQNIGPHITRWEKTNELIKQFLVQDDKHTRRVKEVSMIGDEALLKHAPHLQGEAASLALNRSQAAQVIKMALEEAESFRDIFMIMSSAEQNMSRLPDEEKKLVPQILNALARHADYFKRTGRNLPAENKEAEKAITRARNNEIARATQQRADADAAVAEAEASGRRVKFNEYLNSGLVTDGAIKAPKTARFTRKPVKAVSTP